MLLAEAADAELLDADEEEAVLDEPPLVADAPLAPEEPDEPEPALPVAPAALPVAMLADAPFAPAITTVVEGPTLTEKYESVPLAFCARDVTPTGRPAGIVATAGCVETPAGRLVIAAGWLGWPVTTPRELVCVRKLVAPLLYVKVVV